MRIPELKEGLTFAFVDGSCLRNPGGPCGAGALLVRLEGGRLRRREIARVVDGRTSNAAELSAILVALASTDPTRPLVVCSDSTYALGAASGTNEVRANADLVRQIRAAARGRSVEWRHVRGHAGHPGQERAHDLATAAATGRRCR